MKEINLSDNARLKIIESHLFWFDKRRLFNIIVGIFGIFGLLGNVFIFDFTEDIFDILFIILGSALWGIIANSLYSLGFELDALLIHKSRGEKSLGTYRETLFWIGTILYAIISFIYPLLICIPIPG